MLASAYCRMLALGVRSGSADTVIQEIARRLSDDGEAELERKVGRIEPALTIAGSLLVGVILVPVAIGMVIRAKAPALAATLERGMSALGALVLILAIAAVAVDLGGEIVDMVVATGPAVLVFNLAVILVGGALAWIARIDRASQLALAVEYGIKNSTLGLVIALTVVGDEEFAVPAAVYSIVMYLTAVIVIAIGRRIMAVDATSPAATSPAAPAR